jgi:PAS domain S-box-containing protein
MFERIRRGGRSIQAQFLLYSSALLIPVLTFSGLMILRSAALERAALDGEITERVRSMAMAIDRELASTTTTLKALATSPALAQGDFRAFYGQAKAAQEVSGYHFFLTNRSGQQVLNSRMAWGSDLPTSPAAGWDRVFETGSPSVSSVYTEPLADRAPVFSVNVPVMRGKKVAYVLSASIPPERIVEIFDRSILGDGWLATVTDRDGKIVARSEAFADYVGKIEAKPPESGEGTHARLWRMENEAGEPMLRASAYSHQSGWLVSTSVAEAIADRSIFNSWVLVITLALSFALLSALLAYLFGRKLSDPVRSLVAGAQALGRGEEVSPIRSSVREVQEVGEALVRASQTRQQMERSLRESEDRLRLALASAETGTWDWDLRSGKLLWDQRMRELWGLGPDDSVSYDVFAAALNPLDRERTFAAIERAQDPDDPVEYNVEYRVKGVADGVERWVSAQGRAHFADGAAVRMTGTARDITERKRFEEHTQLLMREVTHRSKNLLAVIQAMARQTKFASKSVNDFEVRFSGRLQALAASHDLLVQRDWQGIPMTEIVRSQLGHYFDQHANQIDVDGQAMVVSPEAAQNIGLAVHELSTNAAKYGALSTPEGRVTVRWQRHPGNGSEEELLRVTWEERGGPEVKPPTRRGFGQLVMQQLVARALHGEASLSFAPTGVTWSLEVPSRHILAS